MAMSPATNAIQVMLMTPSANSDAMRAQQQPTHQAPFFAPIRRPPSNPSRQEPSRKPSGTAALAQADVLQRGELVDSRDEDGGPGQRPTGVAPSQDIARQTACADGDCPGRDAGGRPREEVARRERRRRQRKPGSWSCGSTAQRSGRSTGTSSPPSSRPRHRGTSRTCRGRSTAHRPSPASGATIHHQPTAARAKSASTSPRRTRTAANAGLKAAAITATDRLSLLCGHQIRRPTRISQTRRTASRIRSGHLRSTRFRSPESGQRGSWPESGPS